MKYITFDGEEVEDGWWTAQYKTEREVVYIYKGELYTGPWISKINGYETLVMENYDNKKHHDFRPIEVGYI